MTADLLSIPTITNDEYHSIRALSASGMKDLAISPLRYWHRKLNPNREPEEPTPALKLGSALHTALLEPNKLDSQFACAIDASAIEGVLVTIADLRKWLDERGVKPRGTVKADIIAQVRSVSPEVPILDVIQSAFEEQTKDKTVFSPDDWKRLQGMVQALRDEPRLQPILKAGRAEVPLLVKDPDTGVPLKSKLDWITPDISVIFDAKSFSVKRDKSIDKVIADAIWYEGYYRQHFMYCQTWALATDKKVYEAPDFVMGFVESEEPHEVRIKVLRPKRAGEPNLYFERGRIETREHIRTYAEYMAEFGEERPWRHAQEIDPLGDEELPGLGY